jgi:K+-transporting ATPase KdpC subunit
MTHEPVHVMIRKQVKPALVIFFLITVIVGIIYPLVITGIAQLVFPVQSNGNLIEHNGKIVGSSLIGQSFTSSGYFWGRLSSTSPVPYNSGISGGSNLGPTNPALLDVVKARVDALHATDPDNSQPIPVDLVTSSASGLDPDISVAAAKYQVPRIARERSLDENDVAALVELQTEDQQFGCTGRSEYKPYHGNIITRAAGCFDPAGVRHENARLDPTDSSFCYSCCPYCTGRRIHGKGVYR